MEIPIYLAMGLATAGYLKSKKTNEKKNYSKNIYSDGIYDKVSKIEYDKVSKHASSGFESGVVPYFFNTMSETGTKKLKNPNYDPKIFQKIIQDLKLFGKINIKVAHLNPQSVDNTILHAGDDSVTGVFATNEDAVASSFSTIITKNQVKPEIMEKHNNMVPFFGGSVKQNTYAENRQQDGKLESFTGQFKLDQNHKVETSTLFSPIQQDIFSVEVPHDMDRYSTALTYRNNEIPFEQTYVGRGLNNGYTATPSGGYHNEVRALPKNIDQLLVNPKQTYKGKVIKGKHMVGKRTAEQKVYNYIPKVLVENKNGERNFTTTGEAIAQTSRAEVILRQTNRKSGSANIGPASSQNGTAQQMKQNVLLTKDTTLLGAIIGAVQAIGKQMGTQPSNYSVSKTKRAVIQEKNTNNYGYSGQSAYNGQVYNNTPTKHLKGEDMRTLNPSDANVSSASYYGQLVNDTKLKNTGRETIEKNDYSGNLNGGYIEGKTYDPNQKLKTTVKETTETNNYNGVVGAVQSTGQYVYDPFDFAKTTGRQTIENNTHTGIANAQVGNGDGYRTAPTNINSTQRENYSDSSYSAPAEGMSKPIIYDSAYSMRQNTINEVISKNRDNSKQGSKIFNSDVSLTSIPSDSTDYQRTLIPVKMTGSQQRSQTSYNLSGNKVNDSNRFFDTAVLSQLNSNPFNISILSNTNIN